MSNYSNELTGTLFRNERRRNDKDPSHNGSCEINGQQFWIAAWVNEAGPQSKNPGQKFFGLKFKPKDAPKSEAPAATPAAAPPPAAAKTAAKTENLEEDVPF